MSILERRPLLRPQEVEVRSLLAFSSHPFLMVLLPSHSVLSQLDDAAHEYMLARYYFTCQHFPQAQRPTSLLLPGSERMTCGNGWRWCLEGLSNARAFILNP